ncbi:hypothetical protein [Corynebacterium variabile]|uniref:Putative secreted protein n=2 Tax=Corynebacterium variabile TaxID=1727 RepID=G0H9V3_CORVD|nr:hypothetical protein [Corynebacterium variabile]AEK35415.1 putative secreted protein [Corynebacterium variabile DSM 44702]
MKFFPSSPFCSRIALAAVVSSSLLGVPACGDEAQTSGSETSAADTSSAVELPEAGNPASTAPADLIVDDTLTPDGYEYTPPAGEDEPSLAELLGESSDTPEMADAEGLIGGEALGEATTAEPAQCTGLAVDGLTVMDWMFRPAATTATAGYTQLDNDDDGVFVMVTTDEADPASFPADVSECSEFTRVMGDEADNGVQHYTAEPVDISVDGAEVLGAARVTMTAAEANGETIEGEGLGTSMTTLTATVYGISFTVAASEATDTELVGSIASAQAQRITNANR